MCEQKNTLFEPSDAIHKRSLTHTAAQHGRVFVASHAQHIVLKDLKGQKTFALCMMSRLANRAAVV